MKIRITVGSVFVDAVMADTPCAQAIAGILPIEEALNEWGDEFYFMADISLPLDDTATRNVKAGDIGYWPPGPAIAIFFGPTPLSSGQDPVPASEVNLIGKIAGDPKVLKKAAGSRSIRIESLD